ncbi:hypothetical protein [Thermotalea metallivorans]|uniref:Uncharacterized protein n=1 Tax=Thermotalea metallivorans TaxID=520762 RepID=A0A140LA08_9FIRM|nr:hypothetical protein [Thermotalea metallivorans]KXG77383.1 hypothetical protein AN619_05090 [Thermotalea metallivorans]
MAFKKGTFYACKVNVHEMIYNYDITIAKKKIAEAIMNYRGHTIHEGNSEWTFAEVKKLTAFNRRFIVGILARGKDEKMKKLEDQKLEPVIFEKKASESRFVYCPDTEILVFQEIMNKISANQFIEYFNRLINRIDEKIGRLEIIVLKKSKELKQEILELEKILAVEFNLIVPNYSDSDEINKIRKLINDAQMKKFNSRAENFNEGLKLKNRNSDNISENTIIGDQINATIQGYGEGKITGYTRVEGMKEIHTQNRLLIEHVFYDDEIDLQDKMIRILLKAQESRNIKI